MSSAPAARADKGSANFVQTAMKENLITDMEEGLVTMNDGGDICLVTVTEAQNNLANGYTHPAISKKQLSSDRVHISITLWSHSSVPFVQARFHMCMKSHM